ncbi:hypothetical protein CC2G_002864 [Coprinopsis cinerea AmutBmut pab1-1]|nr:hypothetical protein CC2G_002864 [Coprinopsis cinerea AmutBmut pab1-1]
MWPMPERREVMRIPKITIQAHQICEQIVIFALQAMVITARHVHEEAMTPAPPQACGDRFIPIMSHFPVLSALIYSVGLAAHRRLHDGGQILVNSRGTAPSTATRAWSVLEWATPL